MIGTRVTFVAFVFCLFRIPFLNVCTAIAAIILLSQGFRISNFAARAPDVFWYALIVAYGALFLSIYFNLSKAGML